MLNVDWLIDLYFLIMFYKSPGSSDHSKKQSSISLIIIFNNTQTKNKYLKIKSLII